MSIDVLNETDHDVDEVEFVDLSRYVLEQMRVHPQAELCIRFVDEPTMTVLHEQWMDLAGPTDVMSFPMDELRPGTSDKPTPPGLLGDIVVCPQVAEQQAETAGHSLMDEICLLTTHGMLHVLGYDHALPDEERRMFGLQRELLVAFAAEERRRRRS